MGACGLTADAGYGALRTALLQNAMTVAGIVTLVQMFSIGPIGGKVPIVMGTSSGFLGVFKSVTAVLGQGALTYGAILGATIVGGYKSEGNLKHGFHSDRYFSRLRGSYYYDHGSAAYRNGGS